MFLLVFGKAKRHSKLQLNYRRTERAHVDLRFFGIQLLAGKNTFFFVFST